VSENKRGEGEVEDGAELMEGRASEAVIDSVFKHPYNQSGEYEEGPYRPPKACSEWFQEDPCTLSAVILDRNHHRHALLGVRHREVHIQGSVGCDGHITYYCIKILQKLGQLEKMN